MNVTKLLIDSTFKDLGWAPSYTLCTACGVGRHWATNWQPL